MCENETIIPYPPRPAFAWWEDKAPTQESMEKHIARHLPLDNFRHFGIPLYDLEVCAAAHVTLPNTEEILMARVLDTGIVKEPDGDRDLKYATDTIVTGIYLGVFSRNCLDYLPADFVGHPYDHPVATFVQSIYSQLIKAAFKDLPCLSYMGGNIPVAHLRNPDFTPFRLIVDQKEADPTCLEGSVYPLATAS